MEWAQSSVDDGQGAVGIAARCFTGRGKGTFMILCVSLSFQIVLVIQGKSFSTLHCSANRKLGYAEQFGNCGAIHPQLLN